MPGRTVEMVSFTFGLLTLGVHVPEGYGTWSVCVSVRHHVSCHYAQLSVQPKVPTASMQSGKHGVSSKKAKSYGVKKPTS